MDGYMGSIEWLTEFAKSQQAIADTLQSEAARHQKAADSARKRVKQLKRESRSDQENVPL
jgi:hypothetical protein